MLTEEQLEIISEALVPLFQYLEKEVIADIAGRIQLTMSYSRTAEIQAVAMRELGYSPAKIRSECMKLLRADTAYRKTVAQNTLEHKRKTRKLLNLIEKQAMSAGEEVLDNAADMAWMNDLTIWKEAGKTLTDNSFLPQLVEAFRQQTAGTLKNLTATTGFSTMSGCVSLENAYRRELDKAVIKLCTGTFSREKVLQETVRGLAKSGLRSIDFASGYSMQLDTAVRVATRTGCHQLAAKIADNNMERTGENLVYVSGHWGARNKGVGHGNHEAWQGKVYFIKDGTDYSTEARRIGQESISSLWYATGYSADGEHENDPLGLNGYNCRHNHHPWFEGSSELPKENPEPAAVTINKKTYDYYAITQKMRSMERAVRALKREREALKALGMNTAETEALIRRKQDEYREFCESAGMREKSERLRYDCGTSDIHRTKAWKEYENEKEKSSIKEYRVINSTGVAGTVKDRLKIKEYLSPLPKKAVNALEDISISMNSTQGSGYLHSEKTIYLSSNATQRELIHEVGHCLEFRLFDKAKVDKLKENLVHGLTKDDIITKKATDSNGNTTNVFLLQSENFIKEYQSRLYVDKMEEALKGDGTINIDVLGEVVSVAVEYYYSHPKVMKTRFKAMFDLVERSLHE